LAGNRLVTDGSASDAIRVVLLGAYGPSTRLNPRPYGMPAFAHQLSSEQIAAALTYIRGAWGNHAAGVSPVAVGGN
jgi:mono/diheme cytochrome c family protein